MMATLMFGATTAMTGCFHDSTARPKAADAPTFKSRALAKDDVDGLSAGFVVEDTQGRRRTIKRDLDIPRPIEHAWSPNGDLAFLIPPYGPVQIVMKNELSAWIDGGDPTLAIRKVEDKGPAKQYARLEWMPSGDLRFEAACCGTTAEVVVQVPSGKLNLGPWKRVH
ncbi:MAG: hypothetical protein AAFV29_10595 [Myxococcota bacterium]